MREPVIGIDLGTTYSAVATVAAPGEGAAGRPRIIPSRTGERLTPSLVGFTSDGRRVVGAAARALAEEAPESVLAAAKRFLGKRYTPELAQSAKGLVTWTPVKGPAGDVRAQVAGRTLPLTQASAMVLAELKLDAEAYFGGPVRRCVITVPANFDDGQRQATREAASIAGLEVMRLINEPTAAALAYGLSRGFEGRALVFDLGGGTFDVSILEVKDGVFEVKATGGDPHLGGEDFDQRIASWLLALVPDRLRPLVEKDRVSQQRLRLAAERAKRELTGVEETTILVEGLGDHAAGGPYAEVETALTRAFFETLSEPLSRRCLAVCERVMRDAGLQRSAVDAVLLVGGMTRVPLVRRIVGDFFGRAPATDVHPDEAVALGAAVHAHELSGQGKKALLLDVTGHSLSVGTAGGRVKMLIPRNSTVPCTARETFVPAESGQAQARIPVFQGEGDWQEENTKLGEVVLRQLEAGQRGETPIEVTFELSSEGMLSVRARDVKRDVEESVRLEARTALSGPELVRLAQEQAAYEKAQGSEHRAKAEEGFGQLLERGERLLKALQRAAADAPGEDAQAAVDQVGGLLEEGRQALAARDDAGRARVARRLLGLMSAG